MNFNIATNQMDKPIIGFMSIFISMLIWTGTFLRFTGIDQSLLTIVLPSLIISGVALQKGVNINKLVSCFRYIGLLVFIFFVSSIWSLNPAAVLTKSISMLIVMSAAAFYFSSRERPLHLLFWTLAIYGIFHNSGSLILILSGSDMGRLGQNHLIGLVSHKTVLTNISALCGIAAFGLMFDTKIKWQKFLLLFSLLLSVWILAIGNGGQAVLGFAIGLVILFLARHNFILFAKIIALGALALAVLLPFLPVSFFTFLSEITGKDAYLTGRVYIWDYALRIIAEAPLLGHGFLNIGNDIYWQQWQLQMFSSRYGTLNFVVPTLHNQWLEVTYMLGVIGLVYLVIIIGIWPILKKVEYRNSLYPTTLALIAFVMSISAFDTSFLKNTPIAFILFVIILSLICSKKRLQ